MVGPATGGYPFEMVYRRLTRFTWIDQLAELTNPEPMSLGNTDNRRDVHSLEVKTLVSEGWNHSLGAQDLRNWFQN